MKYFSFSARWLLLVLLFSGTTAWAQTIKTLPGDYASFTVAINDINTNFPTGGVTVNVAAGYSEAPTSALPLLMAQGTGGATRQIIFQKSGTGANPKITANWTASSTTVDAIVRLSGADYVTFDGIDLADLTTHTTQATAMEAGYALFRPTGTNGCQNNTIRNCTVTMNRSNLTTTSTSGVPYGIYAANSTAASGTAVSVTTTDGANSNNKFYGNTILNTQAGIYLLGYNDTAAPYSLLDQNNDVGGTATATGNTIQNFGGIATVTTYGIRMNYQHAGNVGYNTVDNSANGGVASPSTFYGVLFSNGTNASGTARNNTVTISQAENASQVQGVAMTLAGTGASTITNNTVNFSLAAAGGVAYNPSRTFLINSGATASLTMSGNTVNCTLGIVADGTDVGGSANGLQNSGAVTGDVYLTNNVVNYVLSNSSSSTLSSGCQGVTNAANVPGNVLINGNTVTYTLTNTGATGLINSSCYGVNNGGTVGALSMNGNTISHTVPASPASVGSLGSFMVGVFEYGNVTSNLTINNNIDNYTIANGGATIGVGGNTLLGVHTQSVVTVGGATSLNGNNINYALTTAAGTTTTFMRGVNNSAALTGPATISNNTITYTGAHTGGTFNSGFGAVSNLGSAASTLTLDGNTLLNSTTTSTGAITVVNATGATAGLLTISNNRYQNSTTASTGAVQFINETSNTNNLAVTGNYFTGFSRSAATTATTYGFFANGGTVTGGTHSITNNYITDITLTGSNPFTGIFSQVSNTLTYNVAGNLIGAPVPGVSGQGISTGVGNLVGLWVGGNAAAGSTITDNTVQNLSGAGQVLGLTLTSSTSNPFMANSALLGGSVSGNTISNLSSSGVTSVYGMYLVTSTAATAPLNTFANRINALNTDGAGVSRTIGMYVADGGTHNLYNNTVANLTAPGATYNPVAVVGLYLNAGMAINAYFNSVYLTGTGTFNSAACYRNSTGATTLRNNIFYNERTGGGSNYAIGTATATGFVGSPSDPSTNSSDYNLFITADVARVGLLANTGYTFANWKTTTGGDASSLSETAAVVPAASLFANPSTGNLSLNAGNSVAWYANGTGTQVASVGTDYAGTARPTTVAAGAPDLGAFEVTPTSTPPALTASAAPARNTTQNFVLGGRTLARLTYGNTGTVPTSVVARYYSGTNPPAPFATGARYANAYFDFSATGGSGYTYQPTLTYDPALLGTIASESAQRISQRNGTNSGYGTFFATVVNPAPLRTLVGPGGLSTFSILAISDNAAPLPVELSAFTAALEGPAAVRLAWTTASEKNSKAFEVERSLNGRDFSALGAVAGAGFSSSPRRYGFVDTKLPVGTPLLYYRLKLLDLDGTLAYSPVQAITLAGAASGLALFPNPAHGAATLTGVAPGTAVQVFDALGRAVAVATADAAGSAQLQLKAGLPAGVYVVRAATRTLRLVVE